MCMDVHVCWHMLHFWGDLGLASHWQEAHISRTIWVPIFREQKQKSVYVYKQKALAGVSTDASVC